MIKIKNLSTGAEFNVYRTTLNDAGRLVYDGKATKRFYNSCPCMIADGYDENGNSVFKLADGYEVCERKRKRRTSAEVTSNDVSSNEQENATETPESASNGVSSASVQPQPFTPIYNATGTPNNNDVLGAFGTLFAGVERNIVANVMQQVSPILGEALETAKRKAQRIIIDSAAGSHEVTGRTHAKFKDICKILQVCKAQKLAPYLYGPAGTGKSELAKQVAQAFGLKFYSVTTAFFKHELVGYGDAAGNFVKTPFYDAFTKGGLFFLDEVDASTPEVLVALNKAISQREFDFPVVGNVTAHPDFVVMAAGNTAMTGATEEYTGRAVQDAAFKNRFFYIEIGYDENIERDCAQNDMSIVNFIHDLRHSAKAKGITIILSYRQCSAIAGLKDIISDEDIIRGCIIQEKESDEVRLLIDGLSDTSNRWAQALKKCA